MYNDKKLFFSQSFPLIHNDHVLNGIHATVSTYINDINTICIVLLLVLLTHKRVCKTKVEKACFSSMFFVGFSYWTFTFYFRV